VVLLVLVARRNVGLGGSVSVQAWAVLVDHQHEERAPLAIA
jgi:hypothetical protein